MLDESFIAEMPDVAIDFRLSPCPRCGATHIDIGHKGPALLFFCRGMYQVVCENCYYRTLSAPTIDEAFDNWQQNISERMMHKIREERGLSYQELGDMSGVARETVRRIEAGLTRGSEATRKKIARVLGVSQSVL